MEKLLQGIIEFRNNDFEDHKELFVTLGKEQKPHTLFIGCSDSRIVPNLITKTLPGEIFVIRNIANLVPPFRNSNDYLATTSAIEFAVLSLEIENIIICGHSNCGGCLSLYQSDEKLSKLPHTKKWLEIAKNVKDIVLSMPDSNNIAKREWMTEQVNIVEQMKNLLTFPFIKEKFIKKEINILGWYYIIETGEIFGYNMEKGLFELIN
ncbi:MAG: carbonic anhydrase [Bacteroidetes bacterium]|nr:carbonic anhydrase [Bacteroidota bacterium]